MQNSWGYLATGQGYQGHLFPVVIGETGSQYLTVRASAYTSLAACIIALPCAPPTVLFCEPLIGLVKRP